ncbi:MAG: shikimate dehydrogenase [Sedimentisphaerales bacterium]|nr:shikimate dehydrogenase [Sedimentisphaerales bacterium]
MTYLTAVIQVKEPDRMEAACRQAAQEGAQMLELRLDYLDDPDVETVRRVVQAAGQILLPRIATCRANWEGGHFPHSESQRCACIGAALDAGAEYVDIELAGLDRPDNPLAELLAKHADRVILSSHDFEGKPANIPELQDAIRRRCCAVGKIAYAAAEIADGFDALDVLGRCGAGEAWISLAMGEAGLISRVLAKKLGAFLSFASLAAGGESAPGQCTVRQMREIYRWDALDTDTAVCGVLGNPISHSLSPAVHNAAFTEVGFNGVYLPFRVASPWNKFRGFLDGLRQRRWLDVRGLSVTIPHKHNALQYIQENGGILEPLAGKIGAVNTLVWDADGRMYGYNTDYAGALDAITQSLGMERGDLRGMPAAIIGAGGVGRALAAGLTDVGCKVTIYNRTVEKAQSLAQEFACDYAGLDELGRLDAKLVVNATRVGMYPQVDASPLPRRCLRRELIVFDTVYNPARTLLLRQAADVGATVVDGVSMFVNQAAGQFSLFSGREAPRAIMRAVLEKHLF